MMMDEQCASCSRRLEAPAGFRLRAPGGITVMKCGRCALTHAPMLWRAVKAAVFVGTVLTLLNQGDALLAGEPLPTALAWKIPLTFVVPFCVTIYGAMTNARR
jgi:hypothetical protein